MCIATADVISVIPGIRQIFHESVGVEHDGHLPDQLVTIWVFFQFFFDPVENIFIIFSLKFVVCCTNKRLYFFRRELLMIREQFVCRNAKQSGNRGEKCDIRIRISILPFIYCRGSHTKTVRHFFLSHIGGFSVFTYHFTYLHKRYLLSLYASVFA